MRCAQGQLKQIAHSLAIQLEPKLGEGKRLASKGEGKTLASIEDLSVTNILLNGGSLRVVGGCFNPQRSFRNRTVSMVIHTKS